MRCFQLQEIIFNNMLNKILGFQKYLQESSGGVRGYM